MSKEESKAQMEQNVQMIKEFFQPSPKEAHFKNKSWIAKAEFEKKQNIKMVYVPNHKKFKDIKKVLFMNYFRMSAVSHIQFISPRICEFMISEDYYTQFVNQIKGLNFKEARLYDATKSSHSRIEIGGRL
jgi:hypothetical protein